MSVRLILLHLTPRLYITRILILSCVWLILYPSIWFNVLEFNIFLGIVIIHHFLCLTVPLRFFYGIFDLGLLLAELLGASYFGISLGPVRSWMPDVYISLNVLTWTAFACLAILVLFRISKIVQTRGKSLIEPFTIFPRGYPEERKPNKLKMLFGRSLWSAHFVGERKTVRLLRGFLGLLFLATIVFWSFSNILFEPMKETALGPIREFRTRRPPTDFLSTIDPPVWDVLIPAATNRSHQPIMTPAAFNQSVTVTAIWGALGIQFAAYSPNRHDPDRYNPSVCTDNSTDKPPCIRADTPFNSTDYPYLTLYRFLCPTGRRGSGFLLPDLAIRVNFSLIAEALAITSPSHPQISLPIIIGMTNSDKKSIKHVFEKTLPTTMIPGFNLAAPISTDIRQIFAHRAMAALGLFQETSVFWEARFEHMYPDLQVPDADRDANVSTLRLFKLNNWSDTRVIQDYRMNSVIAGFADVGGLWTSLSGIFTVIFGASLLHILYGSKPLSIFGIAHSFHYKHMKEETLRLYPNIVNEHKELGKRGLLALLRDHLIDLNFLEKEFLDVPGPLSVDQDNVPLMDIERRVVEDSKDSHMGDLSDRPLRDNIPDAASDKRRRSELS